MAMTKCKECGTEISTKAEACPKCGAKQRKPTSLAMWVFLGFFGLVMYKCASVPEEREQRAAAKEAAMTPGEKAAAAKEQAMSEIKYEAKWQCRKFMERSLKAPSTAEFQSVNDFSAELYVSEGDGGHFSYKVAGYVDAQNSFGAKIRTRFNCAVRKVGDTWQLVGLTTTP